MDLNKCREKIDEIDKELLALFCKRMDTVTNVAAYKKEHQLPILNAQREKEVIEQKMIDAPEDLKEYIHSFFSYLMESSKCYQLRILSELPTLDFMETTIQNDANIRVVCQGTQGAYQHIAAKQIFEKSKIDFCKTYPAVFEAVKNGEADYGVVPLENSTAGSVNHVYDLLRDSELFINRVHKLKIDHCLVARAPLSCDEIADVYSYIQALDQCSDFLQQHPSMQVHNHPNTALAAELVSKSTEPIAAICSKECAELFGLTILQEAIQNNAENYTKFIVISKDLIHNDTTNEISICIQTPHHAGELNKMLTKFSLYNINMTKIESRPLGYEDFRVLFYINFIGNLKSRNVRELLQDLNSNYDFVKLLGAYECIV